LPHEVRPGHPQHLRHTSANQSRIWVSHMTGAAHSS
jgi:hypothetical protein